jgi:oligopeptide transport system substrate-binding protein
MTQTFAQASPRTSPRSPLSATLLAQNATTRRVLRLLLLAGLAAFAALGGACTKSAPKDTVRFALTTEPPNLNSMKATDTQSFFVIGHTMEGLTRNGRGGESLPGVAEKWEINDQGARFFLRKDAKWSDGKAVTAKDFLFSWKTALDPKTASEYAFILYPLKNAEAINKGKAALDTLGVKAPDDFTIEITFEKPCGYFLGLTAFPTYLPVREDFYTLKKDKYAADAGDLLFNGPFKLVSWTHGAALRMEKNENYWNAQAVKLKAIDIPYITSDNSARFNLYKDQKTDLLEALGKDDLPRAQQERLKLKSHADGTLAYLEFNFREGRATRNKNLRKAIQLVFNPDEYINKVVGIPGTRAGSTLVPGWVRGTTDLFRKEYPVTPVTMNLEQAKALVEKARQELGGTLPPLVWLTGDTPGQGREAEYFQNQFKEKLGIELKIEKQIFKQRLAKMTAGDFDIVSAGWGPDFADPMTFAELLASWNENNRGKWVSAAYDALIRKAQSTSVQKVRMDAMAQAEKIALEELPLLPLSERTIIWTHRDQLSGVVRNVIGPDPDFTYATIQRD